jgi:predicted lipoprotein with Yx(FWY)xxD motif
MTHNPKVPDSNEPSGVRLATESSLYGDILTTGTGRTLYALSTDTRNRSTCSGGCLRSWSPLRVVGPVLPGPGVQLALLDQLRRTDGTVQVSYGGHPLYTFRGDLQAGQINGQASRTGGGIWLVVSSQTGQPVANPPGGPSPGAVKSSDHR